MSSLLTLSYTLVSFKCFFFTTTSISYGSPFQLFCSSQAWWSPLIYIGVSLKWGVWTLYLCTQELMEPADLWAPTPMEESESLGEDPRISDFSRGLVIYSSLLGSIFCTMVHVCTSSFKSVLFLFFLKSNCFMKLC